MTRAWWSGFLVALTVSGLFSGSAHARDDEPSATAEALEAGKALLREGDAMADKGDTTEAVIRYKQAFEKLLPGIRKLSFQREVLRDVTARENLKDVILRELDRERTPEQFRAYEQGLKAVGLLPADIDLKAVLVKVYADEIAAFYDPRTDTMHLIREGTKDAAGGGRKVGFLERLMGRKDGFDKDENKTVIAHEMTHALADQHYDLENFLSAIDDDDDDALMALTALVEGEATLTMMAVQTNDWTGKEIATLPAEDLGRAFSMLGPLLPMFGGKNLRGAPAILRESLIFPYIQGMVFCAKLTNDDSWGGIDAAYKNPPLSTEQILHPGRYGSSPDAPVDFDLSAITPGGDWKRLGQNVVGEMQLGVLLDGYQKRRSAEGWDGDRYVVFENPAGQTGLVWRSQWDSEADAREFVASYARRQSKKLENPEPLAEELPDSMDREREGARYLIARQGADVVVVEGFDAGTTKRLSGEALAVPAHPKTAPKPKAAEQP